MARGLDKEESIKKRLPERNPFRQEILSPKDHEKEVALSEEKEKEALTLEILARREKLIASPLSGLYHSQGFSEVSHLLQILDISPGSREKADRISSRLFPALKSEEDLFVEWSEGREWTFHRTVMEKFITCKRNLVLPHVDESNTISSRGVQIIDTLDRSIAAARLLLIIDLYNKKPLPEWVNNSENFTLDLEHFALAAASIEEWKRDLASSNLEGKETAEVTAVLEGNFLKNLALFIGKEEPFE